MIIRTLVPCSIVLLCTACFPHEQRVEGKLVNKSDYPAVMTLELSSSSVEDGCKPDTSSRTQTVEIDAHDEEAAALTWTCNYNVNPSVSYTLNRGVEEGKPAAMMAAYGIGGHLETALEPGDLVYWTDGAGIAHDATISAEPFYEAGKSAELPDTEALLASPVRTDGRVLQIFYQGDRRAVRELGVPAERFKPAAENDAVNRYFQERDGVKFVEVYGHGVSGSLSGRQSTDEATVICENAGCYFE